MQMGEFGRTWMRTDRPFGPSQFLVNDENSGMHLRRQTKVASCGRGQEHCNGWPRVEPLVCPTRRVCYRSELLMGQCDVMTLHKFLRKRTKNHSGSYPPHLIRRVSSPFVRMVRSSVAAEVHGLSMGLDSAAWARAIEIKAQRQTMRKEAVRPRWIDVI